MLFSTALLLTLTWINHWGGGLPKERAVPVPYITRICWILLLLSFQTPISLLQTPSSRLPLLRWAHVTRLWWKKRSESTCQKMESTWVEEHWDGIRGKNLLGRRQKTKKGPKLASAEAFILIPTRFYRNISVSGRVDSEEIWIVHYSSSMKLESGQVYPTIRNTSSSILKLIVQPCL